MREEKPCGHGYAPLAQLDRVSDYESEGWGFESLMAHQDCLKGQNP